MANRGKSWEDEFKKSCDKAGVPIIRLRDLETFKSLSNPCDFICHFPVNNKHGFTVMIENKHGDTSLSKNLFLGKKDKETGEHKMSQLKEFDKVTEAPGLKKFYLCRLEKYGYCFIVSLDEVKRFIRDEGNASIKKKDIDEGLIHVAMIDYEVARKNWTINIESMTLALIYY